MNDNQYSIVVIYSLFATKDEALATAKQLLEERLIACANISDGEVGSLYWWNGSINTSNEYVMLTKTSINLEANVRDRIAKAHMYETPAILSWRVTVDRVFFEWLEQALNHR
jgi:periplasmic divalent cation tolerance protein